MSRHIVTIALILACATGPGCGKADPSPSRTPEEAAAHVFELAEGLEKGRDTKRAFAAYHQVVRNYPSTVHGKKAAERISLAQRRAGRRKAK